MNLRKPNRDLRAGDISPGLFGGISKELQESQSLYRTTCEKAYTEGSHGLRAGGVSRILFGGVSKELCDLQLKFQTNCEKGYTEGSQSVGNLTFFRNIGLLQRESILLAQKKSAVSHRFGKP